MAHDGLCRHYLLHTCGSRLLLLHGCHGRREMLHLCACRGGSLGHLELLLQD